MKRSTKVLLLLAVIFLVIGAAVLLFLPKNDLATPQDRIFDLSPDAFDSIMLALENCDVTLREGEKTQIISRGYFEDQLAFSLEDDAVSLKETIPFFASLGHSGEVGRPTGLFAYWTQKNTFPAAKSVEIVIAPADRQTLLSLSIEGGSLTVDGDFPYLTIDACHASVDLSLVRCQRLRAAFVDCDLLCEIQQSAKSFSRYIESFDCELTLNGAISVNSDVFAAKDSEESLKMTIQGGHATITYGE